MENYIYDEEGYKKVLREYFNNIINGRLMSLDSKNISQASLENDAFDNLLGYENNSFTWLKIDGVYDDTNTYNNTKYRVVYLRGKNNLPLTINTSQFLYYMSPVVRSNDLKENLGLSKYDPSNATAICTIDDRTVDPECFFTNHKGEKLLYIHSTPAVTAFGNRKRCIMFAYNNISEQQIKKYIKSIQVLVLKNTLDYPFCQEMPGTTIADKISEHSHPTFRHNIHNDLTIKFVIKLFNEEFREIFKNKLNEII